MESYKNMSPGAQFAIVLGVCATLLLVCWWMLFKDQKAQIETKTAELESLQLEISKANSLKQQLQEFEVELDVLQRKLDTLVKILPGEKDVEVLIRRVENQAKQSNLVVKQFDPQEIVSHDFYADWPISISLQGSYHNLALFYDRISRFDRIINVTGLNMQALKERSAPSHTVSANFMATTFVFLD